MAVVFLYWKKFFDFKTLILHQIGFCCFTSFTFLGKLFDDKIDEILGNPIPIAIVLVLGGVVLLFIDKILKITPYTTRKKLPLKSSNHRILAMSCNDARNE